MAVGRTTEILDDVRRQLAPSNDILVEARTRRERVLDAAKAHGRVRDTYNSGSIAHGTANSVATLEIEVPPATTRDVDHQEEINALRDRIAELERENAELRARVATLD